METGESRFGRSDATVVQIALCSISRLASQRSARFPSARNHGLQFILACQTDELFGYGPALEDPETRDRIDTVLRRQVRAVINVDKTRLLHLAEVGTIRTFEAPVKIWDSA